MKVVVYNLGCKVNQYESDAIMRELMERGYQVSSELGFADCYILNTCAVTNEAERKSRQAVTRCRRYNSSAVIIVCGCASQNAPKQFDGKDGVTYISGVANKASIPAMLEQKGIHVDALPTIYEDEFTAKTERTRAFIKIQDGCNNFCSYCLIPYLRGRNRSRSLASVKEECERLSKESHEIVLTGINLSAYGVDIGSSLGELLVTLKDIDVRIRLGSLEVNVITPEFLAVCKSLKRFCPQFHLSLQSGDDATLKAMNRHYTTAKYLDKVKLIREYFPEPCVTTDLICGFPTECEEQFTRTLDFIGEVGFSDMHIFGYSTRGGTVAAKYKVLPSDIVHERCERAESVKERCKRDYLAKFIGRTLEVLIEDDNSGYSREYIRVYTDNAPLNSLCDIKITSLYNDGVYGEIVKN